MKKLIFLCLFFCVDSFAGLDKLLKSVMPSGTMSNVSKSTLVQDQLSGHLVGGGILLKSPPPQDLDLINFQAPTCRLGGLPCGAQMDLRAGALSFLKAAAMEQFLKDLTKNVGTYAAIMLIKTYCPQCEQIMTYLEQIQRSVNQFNLNSCDMASKIVNGIQTKFQKGNEMTRQSAMVISGSGSDMADIREKAKSDTQDSKMGNKELEALLGENFNLVWKALEKKASNESSYLKELLMSVSGTIIGIKDENNKMKFVHKESLITKDLIEEFIGIGSGYTNIELYVCDETTSCLSPKKTKIQVDSKDTLYGRVKTLLGSIWQKVKENKTDLNDEEENLVALSSIPLINKIQRDMVTRRDYSLKDVQVPEFIEALCYDVIANHLMKMLQRVSEAVSELSYLQLTDIKIFSAFENKLNTIMSILFEGKENAFRRYQSIEQMKMRMIQEEKYFERGFQEIMSSNNRKE